MSLVVSDLDKKRLRNVYRSGAAEFVEMPSPGLHQFSLRGLIAPCQERTQMVGGRPVAIRDYRITRLGYRCIREPRP